MQSCIPQEKSHQKREFQWELWKVAMLTQILSEEDREQICVLQLVHTYADTTRGEAATKTLRQYLRY